MNKVNLFLVSSMLFGMLSFSAVPLASAQDNYTMPQNRDHQRFTQNDYMHNDMMRNRDRGQRFVIQGDQDFFSRHGFFNRYPNYRHRFPGYFYPSTIVIVDISTGQRVVFASGYHGGYSLNRVVIYVSDYDFHRILYMYDRDRYPSVFLNPYNNVITFNSMIGTISSGISNLSFY